MIKKIVHVADIHFRNIQRHEEYRAVCSNFIDQMKKIKPDRLVIAGDLVHSRNIMSPELIGEVSWFLNECSMVSELVIVIPGNHDIVEANKDRMDALTPIIDTLKLRNKIENIKYYKNSEVIVDNDVAWCVFSLLDNNATPEGLNTNNFPGKKKIGLFHGVISGAINDQGLKFCHGSDLERFDSCDIVLCGDIHKRQVLKTKRGVDIIYPGSLIQQNYGETVSQHGYNVIDISENGFSYKFHDIINPVKYLHFKINDFTDIEVGSEIFVNA